MIDRTEDHFGHFEDFPLRWRWNVLPPDVLATIRPLLPARAREVFRPLRTEALELWEQGNAFFYRAAPPPAPAFTFTTLVDTSEADPEPARPWLRARVPDGNQHVVVLWADSGESSWGVVTSWHAFSTYWDDSCYPGGDIAIFPPSGAWLLFYHHEEVLLYGQRRVAEPLFRLA